MRLNDWLIAGAVAGVVYLILTLLVGMAGAEDAVHPGWQLKGNVAGSPAAYAERHECVEAVYRWSGEGWLLWSPLGVDVPGANDDFILTPDEGYWVWADGDC
jgi:hypothetical protein